MSDGAAGRGATGVRISGGAALPIVLWALIALGALSVTAALTATLDWSLARNHRDYSAALGLAEAGLADALAAVADDSGRAAAPDSLAGVLETGAYFARWEPDGAGVRMVAEGTRGTARREIEARISFDAAGGLRIAAWREIR